MASFIHMADVHLGFDQYGLTERFRDFASAFNSATKEARERGADFVIICGDLFNKRAIDAPTLIQAKKVLESLRDAGIPVIVVEGNHDKALMRDRDSWLSFLRHDGLIILLEPEFDTATDGEITFPVWDEKAKRGGCIEIGDVRIFGLGWWGASTSAVVKSAARAIADVNEREGKKFTVLMLHAGIEGYVPRMSGCIDAGALAPLRDCVDYVALGHIHKGYESNDWIYNPGSVETWSITENRWERGVYHVVTGVSTGSDAEGTPVIENVKLIDGTRWRRPFLSWEVPLHSAGSPEDAMGDIFAAVEKKARGMEARGMAMKKSDGGVVEQEPSESASTATPEAHETTQSAAPYRALRAQSAVGTMFLPPAAAPTGTLDSFLAPGTLSGTEQMTPQRTEQMTPHGEQVTPQRTEQETPRETVPEHAAARTLDPVIHLTLTGVLGFDRHLLDVNAVRDHVMRTAAPLHVVVKNETRSPDFDFEVDTTAERSREELELDVMRNIIRNDERFSDAAEELAALLMDLKENPDRPPERSLENIVRWAKEHGMAEGDAQRMADDDEQNRMVDDDAQRMVDDDAQRMVDDDEQNKMADGNTEGTTIENEAQGEREGEKSTDDGKQQ